IRIVETLAMRIWAILVFPINWSLNPGAFDAVALILYLAALAWMTWAAQDHKRLLLPAGLVLFASLPPVQQLLIGPDLQKSRVLYLPSAGFALLLAALAFGIPVRLRATIFAAVLLFQIDALEHNIAIWKFAASRTRPACQAAAECARESGPHISVTSLPGSLNGVYFFSNGFPQCVEAELGAPVEIDAAGATCHLSWDP